MGLFEWTSNLEASFNARSQWPTYSKKKRLWAALGLSVEALLVCVAGALLVDGLLVPMVVGFCFSVAFFWSLALFPDRALGWFAVWGLAIAVVILIAVVALTDS